MVNKSLLKIKRRLLNKQKMTKIDERFKLKLILLNLICRLNRRRKDQTMGPSLKEVTLFGSRGEAFLTNR